VYDASHWRFHTHPAYRQQYAISPPAPSAFINYPVYKGSFRIGRAATRKQSAGTPMTSVDNGQVSIKIK